MPSQYVADTVAQLAQSPIRAMTLRCTELGGVNLGQGICDTPPPSGLVTGIGPAAEAGHNAYTRYDGIDRLRRVLADKLRAYNGIDADPEHEIIVTQGSTGAFTVAMNALLNPGDRVILLEPYYGYHLNLLRVAGLTPVFVPLSNEGLQLDAEALEAQAAGAKALVLNTPGNPSGRVFTAAEMNTIADICKRHDLLCITDEIYEYFLFDDHRHISMATLPGMRERTVTMGGYSKTFSITGWRLGYLTAPRALAEPMGLVNDLYYVCAPSIVQHAVADTIDRLDQTFYQRLASDHEGRRDRFCAALHKAGLEPVIPEGAYYVLADVSRLGFDHAQDAAMHILEQAGVAGVPGSAFWQGAEGERWIRFCFGKDDPTLDRAIEQLAIARL
ncbi:MAG: pyridoxal phosphate-dependent aminotransferase [Natronospirillum sp.]|uniref:pyridoxal phosphate-dependent aminotransferase n=1 Tax=Natronospirillum sp. TaxID=2812955 RepID=UPI0025EFC5D1|nr:pyridoxal phosphate-dependent aminotransferase [Natronospirillum sp.]MCH8552061.1 pyridoxal phosphate-dependent aminotransferase [Natronospirillum sp.]